ncbi:MAG: aminoacyl-tRNA hydrolase [Oscillospiraceae bacterium]|nr:aminoacyl-tRNA hydrolase [Oscillospiraceae bacterium]
MFLKKQPIEYIVAGLGNPGDKYFRNRHNVGFMCIDYISQKEKIKVNKIKFRSVTSEGNIGEHRVLLIKPQTYMNLSGEAIREAMTFYKIPPANLIVIHDDINLDVGVMRIKRKGSDGGQKGVKNIIAQLSAEEFPRIKIGVGLPPPEIEMIHWVTGDIPKADQESIFKMIEKSYEAIKLIIDGKIDNAMNLYN